MARSQHRGWAIPPRLHVFLLFMTQFTFLIVLLGIAVPWVHDRGIPWLVLVPATAAGIVLVHLLIGAAGKLLRVRCGGCGSASRYQGFGWWPFIYRYVCPRCGNQVKYEVSG